MTTDSHVLVIAEAGVNHNGDPERAARMVDAAADAGADAIKFQTFRTPDVLVASAPKAKYQLASGEAGESQREMIARLELDVSAHHALKKQAEDRGIAFMSSPFDLTSLAFLINELGLNTIKVASGEITHLPLLQAAGACDVRIIMSTGMSTLGDIERALGAIAIGRFPELLDANAVDADAVLQGAFGGERALDWLRKNVSLLHCTTEYPAPVQDTGLAMMEVLSSAFGLPVGFSDHTVGTHLAVAAVARGATIVEKHFTLDRDLPGPDHKASLEPAELAMMIRHLRDTEMAIGTPPKTVRPSEAGNRRVARRGLVATRAIKAGEVFSPENLGCKRPEVGIPASRWFDVIGRTASRDFQLDESIEMGAEG